MLPTWPEELILFTKLIFLIFCFSEHCCRHGTGTTNQVCCGGRRYGGEDVYAHILHHRQLPWRIRTDSVSTRIVLSLNHILSQQGVWVPFWTPKPLKRTPQDTQTFLCGISKNLNLKLIIDFFFHLLIIPMTLFNDIMPYFDEFIHVYG